MLFEIKDHVKISDLIMISIEDFKQIEGRLPVIMCIDYMSFIRLKQELTYTHLADLESIRVDSIGKFLGLDVRRSPDVKSNTLELY